MRFKKLRIMVGVSMLLFLFIVSNIYLFGFVQSSWEKSHANEVPLLPDNVQKTLATIQNVPEPVQKPEPLVVIPDPPAEIAQPSEPAPKPSSPPPKPVVIHTTRRSRAS